MSQTAPSGPPVVVAPKSIEDLVAMALAMEREAASHYDRLAQEMARHGNHELADLFESLGAEERKHEAYVDAWRKPGWRTLPDAAFAWRSPEAVGPEEAADAGGVHLMTPYRALRLAVHNEQRAFAFFSEIAATADDAEIRAKAEALAKEELNHVVRLRLERRRAWRAEAQSAATGAAREGPRQVRTMAALLSRARAIETEAAELFHSAALDMARPQDAASADLFTALAADQDRLLAEIDQEALGVHGAAGAHRTATMSPETEAQKPGSYEALRRAFSHAGESFDFYAAVAERSSDQSMMEQAQRLAGHALVRLQRIGDRLAEVSPPSAA